jgi:hypothetical protein
MFLKKKTDEAFLTWKKIWGSWVLAWKPIFQSIFDPKSLEKTLNSLINPQMTIKQKKNHTKPRNQLEIKKNSSELRYGF